MRHILIVTNDSYGRQTADGLLNNCCTRVSKQDAKPGDLIFFQGTYVGNQNKGKSVAKSLSDRTDYAKNGDKTENGQFISSYACQIESVDEEFMLSKRESERLTGRHPKGNIIAYQIRQSLKPGEITPEGSFIFKAA